MPPPASFIVTCYNYGRFVANAVDSLLGQTMEALEVTRKTGTSGSGLPVATESAAGLSRATHIDSTVTNMSHASISRRLATMELLLTWQYVFDALPTGAPGGLRRLRPATVRRAPLTATWNDRSRTRQSAAALLDAAMRSPGMLAAAF